MSTVLFCAFFDCLFVKNDLNETSKSKKQKNLKTNNFFVNILQVTNEKSRIRSRIRIP